MSYPATPPITSPVSEDHTFNHLRERYKGCHACGTYSTPLCKIYQLIKGRRGPFGLKTLCNSCGLRYSQGKYFLVKSHTALAAAGFAGEMINKSVKVHQRMYIKDEDEPNVILRKQFSPKGNILGQTLLLNKSGKRLFQEEQSQSKKRLTKEKRIELLLQELEEEDDVEDREIMIDFLNSVHKRRSGPSVSQSDNGSSARSNHDK